jgi:hypothetical protein
MSPLFAKVMKKVEKDNNVQGSNKCGQTIRLDDPVSCYRIEVRLIRNCFLTAKI